MEAGGDVLQFVVAGGEVIRVGTGGDPLQYVVAGGGLFKLGQVGGVSNGSHPRPPFVTVHEAQLSNPQRTNPL